ncbi:hypothetical protein BD626DRAFT_203941 [Schizophyllum amplum]|uniref:Uncharacterized protein n=1 Tax=Schizophyllum amplum TaxID=97359 RepID=A0A550BZR8_9AGAR|nr:hypothetical protein BD626DRAFT_203941 [Auriculariopsis ampla]
MAEASSQKRAGTGLFIFVCDERRIVVPTPKTYTEALQTCQQYFSKDAPRSQISLHTRELEISPGELIEVTEAAWDMVKGMVNKCEVRMISAQTQGQILEADSSSSSQDALPDSNPSNRPQKRTHDMRDASPSPVPSKKPREESLVLEYPCDASTSDRASPAPGDDQDHPYTIDLSDKPQDDLHIGVKEEDNMLEPGEIPGTQEQNVQNTAGTTAPFNNPLEYTDVPLGAMERRTMLDKFLSSVIWKPRTDVFLPPPVLSYELFWLDARCEEQRARIALLEEKISQSVLVYANWVVKDDDVFVRKLVQQCTGRSDVKVTALQGHMYNNSIAFVVLKNKAEKTALLASSVWTCGASLIMLRLPSKSRSGLHRFLRISADGRVDAASMKRALLNKLDPKGTRLHIPETSVRLQSVGGRNPDAYDVMVKLKPGYTLDFVAPPLPVACSLKHRKLKLDGHAHTVYPPRFCPLCQSGGHSWPDCPLQNCLGPPAGLGTLWTPSRRHFLA